MACQVGDPPAFDPGNTSDELEQYAKVFDTEVVRTKDAKGNEIAEVHLPGHALRRQMVGGKITDELHLDFDWLEKRQVRKSSGSAIRMVSTSLNFAKEVS